MTRTASQTQAWLDTLLGDGLDVHDLGRPLFKGMPQSPNHPPFWHSHPRRHGDAVRDDGSSAANDHISLGTHVGTHIDALSHVSFEGKLFGGHDAAAAQRSGRMTLLGAETIRPLLGRGVLLDVPAALDLSSCAPGYEISPADLALVVERQQIELQAGDVVLVRSGWGARFSADDPAEFVGRDSGVPGVGEDGARWIADHGPVAIGADTIAFERLAPRAGHGLLPAHRLLLVERGIYIIETLDLEGIAARAVHEFLFLLSPLPLVGATGSPVRPLAVVPREAA